MMQGQSESRYLSSGVQAKRAGFIAPAFLVAMFSTIGTVALAQTPPSLGLTTPREAAEIFVAATASGDADRIAGLYAPGAVLLVPGIEPLNGRAAIAHINKRNFELGPNKLIFTLIRAETAGADRAAIYWEWEREVALKSGGLRKSSGRSLVYFRKYPEGWLISADMMQARPTTPVAAPASPANPSPQ